MMNGKPNFSRYAAFSRPKRSYSWSSSRSRPALDCSAADAFVSAPARAARPARSGWAPRSASCSSREARRTTAPMAAREPEHVVARRLRMTRGAATVGERFRRDEADAIATVAAATQPRGRGQIDDAGESHGHRNEPPVGRPAALAGDHHVAYADADRD